MTEYIKPPPIGSELMTQLIDSNMPKTAATIDVSDLAHAIRVQRFYILQHLWKLKLENKYPGLIDRITGVDYTHMPEGIRKVLTPKPTAEASTPPQPPPPATSQPEPPQERAMKKKTKNYGHMKTRVKELVDFVRSHKPMAAPALADHFGVNETTVYRYLYAMIEDKKNVDVPRRVLWRGRYAEEAPPNIKAGLKKNPVEMEEYPIKSVGTPAPTEPAPAPAAATNVVGLLEAEALKALRGGDLETAKALGVAINAVEKNKKSV